MNKNWEVKKLGEVCTFINGRAYKKEELLNNGKYPVLRVGNFFTNDSWYYSDLELPDDKYCDSGDLLYAWSASFGPKIWSGNKVIFHYHIWKIIQDESQILKEFLYLFLLWDTERLKKHGNGTAMVHVTKGNIENTSIHIPPLHEQQRIVTIIEESFAVIDKAKENAEKNLQNSCELFESYLQSVFANPGEGWEEKKLGEISVVNMGQSPKGSSYNTTGDGVPLINGPVEFGGNNPFSKTLKTKFTTEPTKMCKRGDLILCVRGSTTGRMNIAGFDSCIGRGVASISSAEYQDWINQYINFNRDTIYKLGTGATFPNVSSSTLSNLLIPIPPKEQQRSIVAKLDALSAETKRLEEIYQQKLTALDELKKSVLQKAFNGELTGA